jgi:hypothetical protein
MGLAKQAKVLSKRQIAIVTALIQQTRYPARNQAIFLLSVKAGLRAKEIASLTWDMVTDAEGNLGHALHLRNEASKGARIRSSDPVEQGTANGAAGIAQARQLVALCHHNRTVRADISQRHREPVR